MEGWGSSQSCGSSAREEPEGQGTSLPSLASRGRLSIVFTVSPRGRWLFHNVHIDPFPSYGGTGSVLFLNPFVYLA